MSRSAPNKPYPEEIYGPNPNEIYMCTEEEYQAHARSVQLQNNWSGILDSATNGDISWIGKIPDHLVSRACILTSKVCKDLSKHLNDEDCEGPGTAPMICNSDLAQVKPVHIPLASFTL